ncbi:MAG: DUF3396 domain-containing protein [Candidatus Thiosymbion ectosymbiont of Robbea hypermnestra]|nr:DUF3396 domain-containing protein [Candidatus Thiosymbion ectosymbiont of Robbea hypermnestra]
MMADNALDPAMIDRLMVTYGQRRLAVVAMLGTFYVPHGHDPAARRAMAELIDAYYAATAPHLRWAFSEDDGLQDLRKRPLPPCRDRIARLSADETFELSLSGAEDFEDASPFSLSCLMSYQQPPPDMGYLSLSFPLGFLEQQASGWFFQWIEYACERLTPLHGYAGLGLVQSMDVGEAQVVQPYIYPFAERFPGLEVDDPDTHIDYLEDGIKGVNWLTIVNDSLLGRIGGRDAVRARCSDRISVHDTASGLILQAGPAPQLGDRETGFIPERYREVYRVLESLQAEYPDILIDTPEHVDPMDFKVRWMTRFA